MSEIDAIAMVLGYALIYVLAAAGAYIAMACAVRWLTHRDDLSFTDDTSERNH